MAVAEATGPGLRDADIDALLAPSGLAAPVELRTLWREFVTVESAGSWGGWRLAPEFELLPPPWAVSATAARRADPELYPRHEPSWLAFAVEQSPRYLLLDCAENEPVGPVLHDAEAVYEIAPSLGALLADWTAELDSGDWAFSDQAWRYSGSN